MTRDQTIARDFAARVTALGFAVYLAERGTCGFVTDAAGSRVLCFGSDGDLGGNYGPPSTHSGTGWRMEGDIWTLRTAEDVRAALYASPPSWCGRDVRPDSECAGTPARGWRYLTTLSQFLALYGSSSRYYLFQPEA